MEDDLSLILSNALFGDGAAAAVLWTRPRGLELVASGSRHAPEDREAIRYVHKNGQLHNQLSRDLPAIVTKTVAQVVQDLLGSRDLTVADVAHFALHGGGDKVITAVAGNWASPTTNFSPPGRSWPATAICPPLRSSSPSRKSSKRPAAPGLGAPGRLRRRPLGPCPAVKIGMTRPQVKVVFANL